VSVKTDNNKRAKLGAELLVLEVPQSGPDREDEVPVGRLVFDGDAPVEGSEDADEGEVAEANFRDLPGGRVEEAHIF
jgi:hypothetical protein